jgi:CubicO group peptidase (beta-lactamase class C family)
MFQHAVVIALLLAAAPVFAQDRMGEIDKLFAWATPSTPGCAVAVSLNGKVVVNRAYGSADLERDVALSPDSVFDAGSLTKQFVAAAVLMLVEEGRLSLSEDVHKYVPELPDYGHRITLDHLLTHTSGIRDWAAIAPLAGGKVDALTVTLRQRGLNFAPGEEWAYSNGGYVLLKEIVARTSGMPFGEFARKRLFEPLGMKTAYTEDLRAVVRNRALAYDREGGRWKMAMLLDEDRGGGGALLSTASDLLIWNEALTTGRLGAFVTAKLQEPATLNNGRRLGYARGLFLDTNRGGRVVWHTGSADGYKSILSRYREQGLSLAILCNSGDGTDRTMFARRIFDLFVPATATPATEPVAETVSETVAVDVDLNARTGLFFSERTGEPLRLVVEEGRLRVAGGPALVPVTRDHFKRLGAALQFLSQDAFELRFLSDGGIEMKSMEGKTTRYRRAQPYAPAPAELKAFAGRYESDELGAVFLVTAGADGLTIGPGHSPSRRADFKPVDRDTFQRGMMTLRFRRDKAGNVEALDYSNPLLRNVPFTRLSDAPGRRGTRP